ncbi:hypothetical protein GGX14DRAFT_560707 [Mycena pura]|uniref:Uncharacterized protein n=1 Tax=Mycena pura TaxID=153505 RepID=A0AAD6VS27_9AGAR|nr:hypothetical protein GGX14DRAFT_560707 [Mycena pura]
MGDTLCTGFLYLCCCFGSSTDPGSDGSGFCSSSSRRKKHRDPREKALKREFMERDYRRDVASGRISIINAAQPEPTTQMVTAKADADTTVK